MRLRGEKGTNEGRLSLDMLIGLSIFLFAFIFIGQFLPSVFTDTRSEISVFAEAYKVSVLLTEDPGRWINEADLSEKGFHWEYEWYKDNISFRPGLAVVGRPGFINLVKLREFKNATLHFAGSYDNDQWVREVFGLNTPGGHMDYSVNISMLIPYSTAYRTYFSVNNTGDRIFAIGPPIPNKKVSRYERIVNLPKASGFYREYLFNTSTPNNINTITRNVTFPVGGAMLYVDNYVQCPPPQMWVRINVTLTNSTSGNTSSAEVFELENDNCDTFSGMRGNHLITRELNDGYYELYLNFTQRYFESPDQTTVTLRFKNLNGTIQFSRVGEIVGDRIVAKLVVTVWEV